MRKHTAEKQELVKRISEQAETIHQLTHHVHLLQSKCEASEARAQLQQETLSVKANSNRFGGSFPVFVKEPLSKTAATTNWSTELSRHSDKATKRAGSHPESQLRKPWPLSDTLDQQHPLPPRASQATATAQETVLENDARMGHSILSATEKSFVSRMTDGISHHSSSFLAQQPSSPHASRAGGVPSVKSLGQESRSPFTEEFLTPSNESLPRGRSTAQTEKTVQVLSHLLFLLGSHLSSPLQAPFRLDSEMARYSAPKTNPQWESQLQPQTQSQQTHLVEEDSKKYLRNADRYGPPLM
jgi:hypothetical protein